MKKKISWAVALTTAITVTPVLVRAHDVDACGGGQENDHAELRHVATKRVDWTWKLWQRQHPTAKVQLLGFNDFHGQITAGKRVAERAVGGAEVLASYLRDEMKRFAGHSLIVHAGDHVGASPPESALLQDEPSIEFLNLLANRHCSVWFSSNPLCNVVGTLGNHEFDEGVEEMLRLTYGGNSEQGPFLSDPYEGAAFSYVSSNVVDADTGENVLPPYVIRYVGGMPVGVIGAVLKDTPSIVSASGVAGVRFVDEASAINKAVRSLRRRGVEAIVVSIHQGGFQTSYAGPTDAAAAPPTGALADIVQRLDSAVDVVVSGHAHAFTNALMKNSAGHEILVTQAFSASTAYADIELTLDRVTRDVVAKSARIVTTYADEGPGLVAQADVAKLVQRASDRVAPLVKRVVGTAAVALTRTQSSAGESALGNLIADAQRVSAGAELAFMNPGGIRADLEAGDITWGELFTIQPFGNNVTSFDLTGEQLLAVLEQQWTQVSPKVLQVSGLTYRWDPARSPGSRVLSVAVGGVALDPARVYRVAANSFLAGGGDGFSVFANGTQRVTGSVDLDALVTFIETLNKPVEAAIEGRISIP